MRRTYQARTSATASTPKQNRFAAPPVIQPKAKQKKNTQLPQLSMGSDRPSPLARLQATMAAQAKLSIGQPNDKYEQEADRVAHDVVQRLHSPIKNAVEPGTVINLKPYVQRSSALTGGEASSELESSINRAKGGGKSLDRGLQQSMGSAMGADFSSVKVHTDSTSDQLNHSVQARAFTTGSDVFFRKGEYNPGNKGGQELIAHELTHVVQQGGAGVQRSSDTVVQRWLKDGKTGNVMNDKVALKYLLDNKIPEQLAQITVDEAKKHDDPVQRAELLRIGRYAMMLANRIPEWTPIKIGEQLKYFMASPQHAEKPWSQAVDSGGRASGDSPDSVLTQKVVQHKDIGEYIPEKELTDIIDVITEKHHAVKPLVPSYWVQDGVSTHGSFKKITHNGLRPVVTPASFGGSYPRPPVSPSKPLYRGTGLTPMQIYQQGGFRAWGIDDDLYFQAQYRFQGAKRGAEIKENPAKRDPADEHCEQTQKTPDREEVYLGKCRDEVSTKTATKTKVPQ